MSTEYYKQKIKDRQNERLDPKHRFYVKYQRENTVVRGHIVEHIILNDTDENICIFLNKYRNDILEFKQL